MNIVTEDKFEAFTWDDKFNTDVEVVDTQHHKLVDLINRLGAISARQTSTAELGDILTELANYTVYHFDTEEKLMKHYEIDAAHQYTHIEAHQHFTAQVTVAAKLLLGSTDLSSQLVTPLLRYLTNWLVQHILGLDKRMTQELLALQSGASHEAAILSATAFMTQSANVLMEALNEMYGKLGDKTLEVMQKNQELSAEHEALRVLNEQLEERVRQRTEAVEHANKKLTANFLELKKLNEKLESAQSQLLQSEKMASIGQLAAGVAHEINNPVGFVNSILGTLSKYITSLFQVIDAYAAAEIKSEAKMFPEVVQIKKTMDFPYLVEDIPSLLKELGVKFLRECDAYDQSGLSAHMKEAMAHKGFAVVIARHPCMLKFMRERRRASPGLKAQHVSVEQAKCARHYTCAAEFACPSFIRHEDGSVTVNTELCVGDGSCIQTCPALAIERKN